MSGKGKASASAAPASKAAAAAPEPVRGPRACYNCGEADGHSLDNCPMKLDRERVRRNKEAAAKAREEAAAKAATAAASGPAVKDPKRKAQRGGVVATEKPAVEIGSAVVAQWQRTPLQLVSEYCQREKRPKPQFQNASAKEAGKTRVAMVLPDAKNKTKDLFFVTDQSFADPTDAKNYTCLLGLHHIGPNLPLERKLPDPYREAWLSMQTAAPTVSTSRRFACADDQAKYDEQQRLASLVKEKEQESKYSKVRMSDAQREYVQDIIRTAQAATPAASASSVSMSAFGGGDDDDDDFGGDALPDDDDEDGNGFSDADDDECTSSSAAVCVAESAEVRALTAELLRLGFSSADIRPAIAFADESDWRSVEAERQKQLAVDREKAHAAALSAKSKKGGLKGFPARPQSAAASVSSSSSASASAATPAMSDLPGALLDNALEWLCIHLPEERLPAQFDPRRKQAKIVKLGQSTPSATSASTPAAATSTPAASAADASALLSRSIDDVWQALPSLGLSATACEAVCARVQSAFDAQCAQANTPGSASGRKAKPVSRTAVQTRALLFIFRRLYAHWNADAVPDSVRVEAGLALSGAADSDSEDGAIRVSVARTEAECQLSLETVTDELDVLSSIFGESECEREPSFSLWRIKLGGSGSGASNASTKRADAWVEFLVCDGAVYPNELPIIVIRHATLTAAQRLSCLQHLVEGFDASALGAPLSYQLFTQLQGSLFQYASMTSDISLPATLGGAPPTPAHEPGSGLPNDSTAASAAPATRKTARPASAAPSSSAVAQSKEPGASASAATAAASAASSLSATAKSHERSHRTARPLRDDRALNAQLAAELAAKDKLPAYRNMQMLRQRLPAAAARAEIIRLLDARQVIVISGETGCGKSTQVPQFVLDACLAGGRGSTTSIVCTQPRRISAIGLAERVASERAEECGRSVGYSVRMQNKSSKDTRLLFATTGILLRRLTFSATIPDISHIIIDEVHERSVEIDFLLVILKRVLRVRKDLRVILMSATANADTFCSYFGDAPSLHIPGRTFPVQEFYLEDILERSAYVPARPNFRYGGRRSDADKAHAGAAADAVAAAGRYSERTVKALGFIEEGVIDADLTAATLWYIVEQLPPAAILVFAPGLGEITDICDAFAAGIAARGRKQSDFRILPLHSTLPTQEQQRVFDEPPRGVTKIVVATNIAETSITVNDVVYVVDTGRMKETQYDATRRMASLVDVWCSRANATQRKGRAGRVSEGQCFRLYTRHTYEQRMAAQQLPEIHRSPLEQLCLQIKTLQTQLNFTAAEFDAEDAEAAAAAASSASAAASSSASSASVIAPMTAAAAAAPNGGKSKSGSGPAGAPAKKSGNASGSGSGKAEATTFDIAPDAAPLPWQNGAGDEAAASSAEATDEETAALLALDEAADAGALQRAPAVIASRRKSRPAESSSAAPAPASMIERVLARTIEPPPSTAVRVAVEVLTDIGALDADEALTPLGAHLARMPVDCRIGKMLIFGAMFRCVTPVVAIAALMSNKSPFVAPLEKREAADAARAKFACFQSDHITLLRAFEGWRAARLEGRSAENEYVSSNFLSRAVLETAEDACGEYMNALVENGFVAGAAAGRRVRGKASWTVPAVLDENAANIRVLKGVLCAGLYPNIIRAVHPDKRYTQVAEGAIARVPNARDIKYFTEDDGRVFMHPTSVNFHTQTFASPWLAFLTKVQTAKVYVRDATVISSYALLLFGGEIRVDRTNGFIVVGDWIRFHADLKIAILIKELRRELDKLMWAKIADPDVDIGSSPICAALLRLVTSDGSDFAERTVGGASSADVSS